MTYDLLLQLTLYFFCFLFVWIGAGLVISAVSELAKSWKLPTFILSFFLLGIITSLPEIAISAIAVFDGDPVIMVGNLLGGAIVTLLGVIPLLGLVGNGVRIPSQLDRKQLIMTLVVIVAPAFLTADQKLEGWEALFLVILYLSLLIFFSFRQSIWEKVKKGMMRKKKNVLLFFRIAFGVVVLIAASNQIVNSTLFFADKFSISPFFVSLIVVALGTNIPEISIIVRSVWSGEKDIALADYLGSASANTLLLGIFTLIHGEAIQLPNHFLQRFSFLAIGLVLFYFFARSQKTLSRKESMVLFTLYIGFILFEILLVTTLV